MRIAVMGGGGTGGYFGALLAWAGEEVTLFAREAHLEAIRTSGLILKSSLAGDFTLRVKATDDPGQVGSVELMANYTSMSEKLDPEQVHQIVDLLRWWLICGVRSLRELLCLKCTLLRVIGAF